jgi:hypothetical protein
MRHKQHTSEASRAETHVQVIYYGDYKQSLCWVKCRYLSSKQAYAQPQVMWYTLRRQLASLEELVCRYLVELLPWRPEKMRKLLKIIFWGM